jgi:hypothetical protein
VNDLSEEQEWLLQRALNNLSILGVPVALTLDRWSSSPHDQQVVRERLEQMSAGVLR